MYKVVSLMTVSWELSRYKLDLVGVQDVIWEGSGTKPAEEYTFFCNENHELGTDFFVPKRIILAVKRVEYASERMTYIILRGRWFHIIVLNIQSPTEDRIDDVKGSFYEEIEHVFDKFCYNI
jgi:hypothetical protein